MEHPTCDELRSELATAQAELTRWHAAFGILTPEEVRGIVDDYREENEEYRIDAGISTTATQLRTEMRVMACALNALRPSFTPSADLEAILVRIT